MKKWNDVYRMVKNGDLDASLLKTGCEDLKAARERAAQVMEGFKESFGATKIRWLHFVLRLGVQKSVEIIPIISMDECWRQQ